MEKPSNRFAIAKTCKNGLKKKEILSETTCNSTLNVTLWLEFLVSAGANQPSGFSYVKYQLQMGYYKTNKSPLTITWYIVPVKRSEL